LLGSEGMGEDSGAWIVLGFELVLFAPSPQTAVDMFAQQICALSHSGASRWHFLLEPRSLNISGRVVGHSLWEG
jgi:hypothetical protein